MTKLLLFPYHPDIRNLVENRRSLRGFDISGVASFIEDAHLVKPLNDTLGVGDIEYRTLLAGCDAVLLLDNYRGYREDKYYDIIDDAIVSGKEIIVTPLTALQLDLDRYGGAYRILGKSPKARSGEVVSMSPGKAKLHNINIPIAAVFGLGKHCGKFETLLLLKEAFEAEFNVATISSNPLGALFGCYTMPPFLFDSIEFQEKVVRFNAYMKDASRAGSPEAIVLSVPEGIMPFESIEFHHFAEYPLAITSAVQIDMAFLCTYFTGGDIYERKLRSLVDFCRNRFDLEVDGVAISRTAFEIPQEEFKGIAYEFLDDRFLRSHYPDVGSVRGIRMVNILDHDSAIATMRAAIARLEGNAGVV